jgi:hypothetical protein
MDGTAIIRWHLETVLEDDYELSESMTQEAARRLLEEKEKDFRTNPKNHPGVLFYRVRSFTETIGDVA